MIFIKKSSKNPDISVYTKKRWKGPNNKKMTLANKDLLRAKNFYGNPKKFKNNKKLTSEKALKFEAYSHPETKAELKRIFNSKCAYCESFIAHIEPGDIEHFRPKAKIINDSSTVLIPGYYWLGATWDNLLLSCTHCNRPNKQLINGEGELVLMGKASFFPLSDESKRIRRHEDNKKIKEEDKFVNLINPCKENPEDFLEFHQNGQIKPKNSKGEKSIEIYGLYRADLVLRRKKICFMLNQTLNLLVEEIQDIEEKSNNGLSIDRSLKKVAIHSSTLKASFDKESEYLAMKKQALRLFVSSNPITNQKLLGFGIDLLGLINE